MEYQLVLEGVKDQNDETLRRLKGILIGDLNLTIVEVQEALDNPPMTIYRAQSREELFTLFNTISHAGGQVAIVELKDSSKPEEESERSAEDTDCALASQSTKESVVDEMNFLSFNLEPPAHREPAKPIHSADAVQESLSEGLNFDLESSSSKGTVETPQLLDMEELKFDLAFDEKSKVPEKAVVTKKPALSETPTMTDATDLTIQPVEPEVEMKPEIDDFDLSFMDELGGVDSDEEIELIPITDDDEPPQASARAFKSETLRLELKEVPAVKQPKLDSPKSSVKQQNPAKEKPLMHSTATAAAEQLERASLAVNNTQIDPPNAAAAEQVRQIDRPVATTAELPQQPKRRQSIVHHELFLPLAAGALLLVVGNIIYFGFLAPAAEEPPQMDSIVLGNNFQDIPAIARKESVKQKEEDVIPAAPQFPELLEIAGTSATDDFTIKMNAIVVRKNRIDFTIELHTSPTPERTPEEIVRNVVRKGWIQEIQTAGFTTTLNEEASFTKKGPVRIFLHNGDQSWRTIGEATVSGRLDTASRTVIANFELIRNVETGHTGSTVLVALPGEDSRIYIASELILAQ